MAHQRESEIETAELFENTKLRFFFFLDKLQISFKIKERGGNHTYKQSKPLWEDCPYYNKETF